MIHLTKHDYKLLNRIGEPILSNDAENIFSIANSSKFIERQMFSCPENDFFYVTFSFYDNLIDNICYLTAGYKSRNKQEIVDYYQSLYTYWFY